MPRGLSAICQLHRRPFAPDLILQQFPPPYGTTTLQDAAAALKLKSGLRQAAASELQTLPAPFLAVLKPDAVAELEASAGEGQRSGLAIVLQSDASKVSYLKERSSAPSTMPLADFQEQYAGIVLLCSPEIVAPPADDEPVGESVRFGFRWFVPELLTMY